MKKDIILAGVGGQGIVSIAATIGYAAVSENLHFKQSEVHGMSQRGGAVQSHFRLSDKEVHSDLIPLGTADLIISVEPMEALRYLPWLSTDGWLITNTAPFVNIPDYPEMDNLIAEFGKLKNVKALNADKKILLMAAGKEPEYATQQTAVADFLRMSVEEEYDEEDWKNLRKIAEIAKLGRGGKEK